MRAPISRQQGSNPVALMQLQQNRYLWVHLVGLAAVPLLLDICLAGLASAGPAFDYPTAGSFQFWAIALLGIVPTLWMQLARPFYIFSLPPLALKPSELTEEQRRLLAAIENASDEDISCDDSRSFGMGAVVALWAIAPNHSSDDAHRWPC